MKDLYKILGVEEDADADSIKKRYRKLAKEFHPDATGGDKKKTERFKEINEAYGILGDDKKRKEYDRLKHSPMGADGMPQGFDPDAFAQAFGGAGGFRGGNVHVSGDFSDLGDIFSSLFGGNVGVAGNPFGGARVRTRSPRGNDLVGRLEVTFSEAALGTRRTVRSGSGGQLEVQVPPGVDTGGRLRLVGHGGAAPKGGQPGDLHLEIVVTPDPHLRRSGDDVEVDLPLSVGEAILGTKLNVPTVDGAVLLTIPPGTSSGAKLRLRGKGVKRSDGSRGDQIGHVQIVVPKIAAEDTETRKLAEELDQRTKGTKVRDF